MMPNKIILFSSVLFGMLIQSCKPIPFQSSSYERVYIYRHKYYAFLYSEFDQKTLKDKGNLSKNGNVLVLTSVRGPELGVEFVVNQTIEKEISSDSIFIAVREIDSYLMESILEYDGESYYVGKEGKVFRKSNLKDGFIVHSLLGDFPIIYRLSNDINKINVEYSFTDLTSNFFRYDCAFFNEPFLLKGDTLINLRTSENYYKLKKK